MGIVPRFWNSLTANTCGQVRKVVENGTTYLVAPVSMINPGVLAGSKGPLLYTPEDTARAAAAWNGVPLTARHPFDPITNEHLSASAPGVWERQGIGQVRNVTFDGKLRGEAWVDRDKAMRVDPRIVNKLESGRSIELSTGLFTDNEEAPRGSAWKGRPYSYFARNHKPDHLAILHDEVGACSIGDGCGVLVNANPEGHNQYTGPTGDKGSKGTVSGANLTSSEANHLSVLAKKASKKKAPSIHASAAEAHDHAAEMHQAVADRPVSEYLSEKNKEQFAKNAGEHRAKAEFHRSQVRGDPEQVAASKDLSNHDHFADRLGRHWLVKSDKGDNEVDRVGPFKSKEEAVSHRSKNSVTNSLVAFSQETLRMGDDKNGCGDGG